MLVLDTSAMIEVAKSSDRGIKISEFIGENQAATTPFCVYESLFPEKKEGKIREMINSMGMVNYDKNAAETTIEIERELRKAGNLINMLDIFIAAICVSYGHTLVTCDNDFKKISKLKVRVF